MSWTNLAEEIADEFNGLDRGVEHGVQGVRTFRRTWVEALAATCEYCTLVFETGIINARFCSRDCRDRAKAKAVWLTVVCPCGTLVDTNYRRTKFCSNRCRNRQRQRNDRARWLKAAPERRTAQAQRRASFLALIGTVEYRPPIRPLCACGKPRTTQCCPQSRHEYYTNWYRNNRANVIAKVQARRRG